MLYPDDQSTISGPEVAKAMGSRGLHTTIAPKAWRAGIHPQQRGDKTVDPTPERRADATSPRVSPHCTRSEFVVEKGNI